VTSSISVTTAAKELSVLRAALHYAEKNGHLIQTPFVEMPPAQPGRDRWVTRSEAARLLLESRREPKVRLHLPLFVMIALYTAARSGAILGLRWTQVDFLRGRIDFNEPGRPRTRKRRAIIPIPRPLLAALTRAHCRASSPYVLSYDGKRIGNIRKSFKAAAERAGLEGVTPHVLRHTAGTWLAQRGVPLWQIAGWLGHSLLRTTELYAHHSPDHFEEAKRAMERR
jgi:integrase